MESLAGVLHGTTWAARILSDAGVADLQALFEACQEFNQLVSGEAVDPHDAEHCLRDVPPGKSLADKSLLGIVRSGELIGVLDSVRGYPTAEAWFVGLLLLLPAVRGGGLGRQVMAAYEQWAAQSGARAVQLGVVEDNNPGLQFWAGLGYRTVDVSAPRPFGRKLQRVFRLEKRLDLNVS